MSTTEETASSLGGVTTPAAPVVGSVDKPTTTPNQVKQETDALPVDTTATEPPKEDAIVPAVTVQPTVAEKIVEVVEAGKPDPAKLLVLTEKPSLAAVASTATASVKVDGDGTAVADAAKVFAGRLFHCGLTCFSVHTTYKLKRLQLSSI